MLWIIVGSIGAALCRLHFYAPAAFVFRRIVAARPDDHFARWYLAAALHQQQRFDEAIGHFQELTRWRFDPDLYAGLGESLQARNRHAEAIEAFSKALVVRPDDTTIRYDLAGSYAAAAEYEPAIAEYRAILAREPGHSGALGNLGIVLGHAGRWEESAECCRRAVELEPSPLNFHNLGIALAEFGDLAEAEQTFRRALELQPGDRDFRVRLAMVLSQRGRLDDAVALFTQSPMSAAENGEGLADLVRFLLVTERVADALRIAQEVAAEYPDLAATQTVLGWSLLETDRFSDAAATFERALTLDAAYADALAGRAATHSLLGEHRRALDDFSRLADIEPDYFARNPDMEEYLLTSKKAIVDQRT